MATWVLASSPNCKHHSLSFPGRPHSSIAFIPSSSFPLISATLFVSLNSSVYQQPKLFTGWSDTEGMTYSPRLKWSSLFSFPFLKTRLLDFFALNSNWPQSICSSSLLRIAAASSLTLFKRVRSSMKALIGSSSFPGDNSIPVPSTFAAWTMTSIPRTNRIGDMVHPMGMPTCRSCHLVLYFLVVNYILNSPQ